MIVDAQVTIQAPRAAVWAAVADIEHSASMVSGILGIEIVERPAVGLTGLRRRETRDFFGKPATVEKWITEAAEGAYYRTRAESDGCVFLATMQVVDGADGTTILSTVHDSQPVNLGARLMMLPMGLLFKRVARKALRRDIRAAVEEPGRHAIH
ncbi:hypothetical protein E4L96_19005 [Massilia arenosa]|uniref:SRPBCC family protein n=1 Tax=Zemynaea arenosa TaxID=2561931 RepID=A0A4Y9RY23_9BURK|nr:SRPBCC family protein [Massilia arenosa]TFW13862.1 hypothetical protein E4L96_19005 [Massilia arenosa]